MTGWLLESLEIEGFRGINNEGDPLRLGFSCDAVNSVFAPNAVGKSSIFDALAFAIRGSIRKLDTLPASERGSEYYVNRFHTKAIGTIKITVVPDGGGTSVCVTVTRTMDGKRSVSGPPGVDAEALLASLDRDFVLLDHKTFQTFIDDKAIDRGRAFSGLLGLSRYSSLRQELQGLANTRAFNGHFETAVLTQRATAAQHLINQHTSAVHADFAALTQTSITEYQGTAAVLAKAHEALNQIPVLTPHCAGKSFAEIVIDDCLKAVSATEVGTDKDRLAALIRAQGRCEALTSAGPTDADFAILTDLAIRRDQALADTAGSMLRDLYLLSRDVIADESWLNKSACPICDHVSDHSLLDQLQAKLARYEAVEAATVHISTEWKTKNWAALASLEQAEQREGEPSIIAGIEQKLTTHAITAVQVKAILEWRSQLLERLAARLLQIKADRHTLEQRLPPSLVAVTTSVEAARRLQSSLQDLSSAEAESAAVKTQQSAVERIKAFLDAASSRFATAEGNAATRRLQAVQPLCKDIFSAIMHQPVHPMLVKPKGGEEVSLSLSRFWSLNNVSAQALLPESFRNALAVSVYLAAASLYGGPARFVVLDDITSSFDAGHQFHLMEVIRNTFARPGKVDGPQVIILSHDTLLEKLFNKNTNQGGWSHQRLEGTARTAVLPQSNAVNRVKDATVRFLNAGQVEDGAIRLRQYLEFKLLEIISRVQIPVPVDFALDDQKKQVQASIDAIEAAVRLHQTANSLVLDAAQISGLQINIATITGNFLSHFATGSTQAFSAPSLLGVVSAIDAYADCFTCEDPAGSGKRRYYRSLSRR